MFFAQFVMQKKKECIGREIDISPTPTAVNAGDTSVNAMQYRR